MIDLNQDPKLKEILKNLGLRSIGDVRTEGDQFSWKMKIKFDTKTPPYFHLTGDVRYENPGWGDNEHWPYPIESLEFYLPIKFKIVLEGFELYNFFIEALAGFGNKAKIEAFFFCGAEKHVVAAGRHLTHIWKVSKGAVLHDEVPFGQEYNGTPAKGWRSGSPKLEVKSIMVPRD